MRKTHTHTDIQTDKYTHKQTNITTSVIYCHCTIHTSWWLAAYMCIRGPGVKDHQLALRLCGWFAHTDDMRVPTQQITIESTGGSSLMLAPFRGLYFISEYKISPHPIFHRDTIVRARKQTATTPRRSPRHQPYTPQPHTPFPSTRRALNL